MSRYFRTPSSDYGFDSGIYEPTPLPSSRTPPTSTFTKQSTTSHTTATTMSTPTVCNICLNPITFSHTHMAVFERAVTLKKCGHVFGSTCLDKWLENANTCPLCRIEVKEDVVVDCPPRAFALGVYMTVKQMQDFHAAMAQTRVDRAVEREDEDQDENIEEKDEGYGGRGSQVKGQGRGETSEQERGSWIQRRRGRRSVVRRIYA
ncbi:hypothetical protein K505DRAFT_343202 [Melanomma pulvis-pyrius CBS 109.77]|uniref:RING-type domain-containing protein n=1 Tax=Melanomma pulvis-pyrius CBS 109.77 TaxID=1314802 RepID=A0A6A6WT85_9PLEO|nr:hypothetical protein K505DRAFT_343202 [Melanomma pulvis-pyrius CBS 109.77]